MNSALILCCALLGQVPPICTCPPVYVEPIQIVTQPPLRVYIRNVSERSRFYVVSRLPDGEQFEIPIINGLQPDITVYRNYSNQVTDLVLDYGAGRQFNHDKYKGVLPYVKPKPKAPEAFVPDTPLRKLDRSAEERRPKSIMKPKGSLPSARSDEPLREKKSLPSVKGPLPKAPKSPGEDNDTLDQDEMQEYLKDFLKTKQPESEPRQQPESLESPDYGLRRPSEIESSSDFRPGYDSR